MNLSQKTFNALAQAFGPEGISEATELDGLLAGADIAPGTVTNTMLAPLALQVPVKTATAAIGYATGAGTAVTQLTNRTTGVTANGLSGTITTRNDSLAGLTGAAFVVTNSSVAIGDVPVVAIQSGSNGGNTDVTVVDVAAGSFTILVSNGNAAAGTAETGVILINFAIIKAVSA